MTDDKYDHRFTTDVVKELEQRSLRHLEYLDTLTACVDKLAERVGWLEDRTDQCDCQR